MKPYRNAIVDKSLSYSTRALEKSNYFPPDTLQMPKTTFSQRSNRNWYIGTRHTGLRHFDSPSNPCFDFPFPSFKETRHCSVHKNSSSPSKCRLMWIYFKSWDLRAPMIWDNSFILRAHCAFLTSSAGIQAHVGCFRVDVITLRDQLVERVYFKLNQV